MRKWLTLVFVLLTIVVLVACGAPATPTMNEVAPAADMARPQAPSAPSDAGGATGAEVTTEQPAPDERKMIYTGNISIVVKDPAAAMQQVEDLASSLGGYTAQSQLYQYNAELMSGNVTIRVPADQYEAALASLRTLGQRVLNENSTASDVTAEYTDLEAQLRNLQAAERELAAMLTEVRQKPEAKPGDILEVYNALSQKRGEIEQVQGRLNYLQNQVGFSTISVDLTPDQINAPVLDEGWRPLVTVRNAFRSLLTILQGLLDLIITLVIVVLPVLLLLALPVALVLYLVRRLSRRRKPARIENKSSLDS
ncbi:MAG: DUF4349 domain-containing protein [Anaerolineae bacterium]